LVYLNLFTTSPKWYYSAAVHSLMNAKFMFLRLGMYLHFLSTAQCGSPQTFSHATPESSDTSSPVGTELVYHCDAGYQFITGSNSHTVECLAGNSWEVITDCESKYEGQRWVCEVTGCITASKFFMLASLLWL